MTAIRLTIEAHTLPGASCGPYREVAVGVQVRKDTVDRVAGEAAVARWDLEVELRPDGDWRGPAVHGPRGERFLYLVWEGRQGDAPTARFRRAKLRLDAVPAEVVAEARDAGTLVGRLGLTDRGGMPVCASVRPPDGIRWSVS